ncbi:putative transcription factor interactor and regulator Znf-B family [Helianthus annuus]|uniref:Putative B-box-type zinc finger n=1 Tax=Helianthus annuus TaxID=4232 RepID=A0A251RMN2_HELAN|nr:zinc finger protein CONSTANS-LIKE 1 [Helianthus annuus]KAF5754521.1 putative transcription factor interactor and regulator Znf-B family [Helianthus annuus]KAJ0428408.1 putative transcription factor interactor and regulator Znf-B family [Helianthus annuus]KAJ0432494.1 putative transcription factor interactor and regulator Znf-B family [Helianthus annuus]KAJ0635545.1 putative transcription factor interactor and regulator Znf-B family [Helianthus annuus]KAJ0812277.1 putative transcription fact
MKTCELCKSAAKIYCDSDQASLCWTCDNKVHSANFLVARHSRSLLCRKCQSTTPWTASGEKLGPSAVSICEKCVVDATAYKEEDDEYEVDEDSENEIDVDDEEEDSDNQVVPLSFTPPPPASSSSCCDYSGGGDSVLVKRKRENVPDLSSEDDCLSVQRNHRVVSVESSEAIEGNRGTLYHFLPLSSEAMGEKTKMMSSENKNKTESVVGGCKGTRVVVDLNSDC